MATPEEIAMVARALANGTVAPDQVDWSEWSHRDAQNALSLACNITRARQRKGPQRRALRLFRSWLRPDELAELRRSRSVTMTGAAGGRYRILPNTGTTQRVERHGSRWYVRASYCLHPDEWIPPADVALAHYLCLRTDEASFLALANEHQHQLWDGAYLRRLNAARAAMRQQLEEVAVWARRQ